jgi:hypothetical protein
MNEKTSKSPLHLGPLGQRQFLRIDLSIAVTVYLIKAYGFFKWCISSIPAPIDSGSLTSVAWECPRMLVIHVDSWAWALKVQIEKALGVRVGMYQDV